MRFKVNGELIVSGLLLIAILGYIIMSIRIGLFIEGVPDSGLWPFLIGVVGLLACAVVFIRSCRQAKERQNLNVNWRGFIIPGLIVALTVGFSFCLVPTGYFVATFPYCLGLAFLFEVGRENRSMVRKVIFSFVVALVLTMVGYIMFQLIFDVRLPEGWTPGLFELLKGLQF